MFGWFQPVCPCDPAAKPWVEEKLRWLVSQFGLHVLLERPVILPTKEFLPDNWDCSREAAQVLFNRVCDYMGIDPSKLVLKIFRDKTPTALLMIDPSRGIAAGTYKWGVVRIEECQLERPDDLVGVMAHELSHHRLLGESRYSPECFDNELLTDLTAVFFGFGIFLCNNPRKSTGQLSHWPGTKLYRPEYLSEPMMGYALAHIAWHRDEERPVWYKHLNWPMRAVFKQGLRYLHKTLGSSFLPVRLRDKRLAHD